MTNRTAVITGGGSGVGRAIALALLQDQWRVAIVGRRADALATTAAQAGPAAASSGRLLVCPCDIGQQRAVETLGREVRAAFGDIELLVNAAGTNVPKRSLEELSLADYHAMLDANLHGAYYCVQAFLPGMRARGSGTIINIVSEAAKQASPKAGPAYCMSKFGMLGLTQSINAEERGRGIRACAILPGDIDTEILDKRPVPPAAEARQKMLRSEDVAECALLAIRLPARAIVEEILIRPR